MCTVTNSPTELLDASKTTDQANFTIQTIAPDRRRRPASSQPQKEIVSSRARQCSRSLPDLKGDNSPLYCMPFPKGNARIDLGLCIAQVILRSTYRSKQSVPNWSLANNDDFTAITTAVCRVGRHIISKVDNLLQADQRKEKQEIVAFRQMESVTAIFETICGSSKAALPPIPTTALQLIVDLCTRRLTGRIAVREASSESECQQSINAVDQSLVTTLENVRTRRAGRCGGIFWNLLADQWIHEIKEKSQDGPGQMLPVIPIRTRFRAESDDCFDQEIRQMWVKVIHCLVLPLAANPVSIAQVIDPSSLETISQALQQDQTAEGTAAGLNFEVETALARIASVHSASSAQLSARGTKRKRNQDVSSQHNDRPDPALLPTGIQLSIVGKEEFDVGLYKAFSPFGSQQSQPDGPQKVKLPKSVWHSDDVHRHCDTDWEFAEFLHECWDPMAKLLCECLPEDPNLDLSDEYTHKRKAWQEEWTTKNYITFQDMLRERETILYHDVCARIESLGKW